MGTGSALVSDRFAEKVALVTGAGSGMGRAITIRLAEEGASVLAVDIDGERLEETLASASGACRRDERTSAIRRSARSSSPRP